MTTSQTTSLFEPTGDERVPPTTLAYFRARNKSRLYDFVISIFERSKMSQATLARRMGKKPEIVNRLLSSPGNWESDTFSDLLFAINGSEAEYVEAHPLTAPKRNHMRPDWVTTSASGTSVAIFEVKAKHIETTSSSPSFNFHLRELADA